MNRLSISVLKSNKLFSFSLFLIYVIITVILFLMTFFYPSVNASIDNFLSEYGIPDAEILTTGTPREMEKELENLEGVSQVDGVLTIEEKVALSNNEVFTLRFSNIPDNSPCKYYNSITERDVKPHENSVLISEQFAKRHNLDPGDKLRILRSEQEISIEITDIVACPETISVARDVNSWFDSTQYAFVYVSENILNNVLMQPPVGNVFRIWMKEDSDQDATLNRIQTMLGDTVISSTLKKDSPVFFQIHSTTDSLKAIVTYMPTVIFLMGLLFCSFFVYQIIFASRNMIATLQSLGMGTVKICGIFIRYNILLCTIALIIGGLTSFPILGFLLDFYKDFLGLPEMIIDGDIYFLPLVILGVYLIGILSCIICTGPISDSDPAVIFAGVGAGTAKEAPILIGNLKMNAYAKISLISVLRNKKRLAIMCLCNIACLILTFLSFSVLASKFTGMDFMFNKRMAYDYIVISDNKEAMDKVAAIPEVEKCEYTSAMVFTYEDEYMRLEVLDKSPSLTSIYSTKGSLLDVPEDGIIVEEGFARRHGLGVGDSISINDISLTITDICRQYFCSAQYISPKTAQKLGINFPNTMWVRLSDRDKAPKNFRKQISEMDEIDCFFSISERQESAIEGMRAIDVPCYLFVAFGIIIGAIIISNINILSIQQRKKQFATLSVLGSSGKQFTGIFLLDIGIQYIITLLLGLPLARLMSIWILRGMSSVATEFVLVHILIVSLVSAGAVLIYLLLSLIFAKGTINRLDLVEIMAKR